MLKDELINIYDETLRIMFWVTTALRFSSLKSANLEDTTLIESKF
jgi:hypothetical protein